MDELSYIVLSALVNGAVMALALYIGVRKGVEKTVDVVVERVQRRLARSPAARRLEELLERADKVLGDDELVGQATRFFKEAADLVSSREARAFFASLAELLRSLTSRPPVKEVERLAEEDAGGPQARN